VITSKSNGCAMAIAFPHLEPAPSSPVSPPTSPATISRPTTNPTTTSPRAPPFLTQPARQPISLPMLVRTKPVPMRMAMTMANRTRTRNLSPRFLPKPPVIVTGGRICGGKSPSPPTLDGQGLVRSVIVQTDEGPI
jgi:hypothetical protein